MAESVESIVTEHLELYHGVIVNGPTGNDQLYPWTLQSRCFSPIYNYLVHDHITHLVNNVDKLHQMAQQGKKEKDLGTLAEVFVLLHRARFFLKKTTESLDSDQRNPNTIQDPTFYSAIAESNKRNSEILKTCLENIAMVMQMMFGSNWKEDTKVLNILDQYAHYWEKHENFAEMEKVGLSY